MRASFVVTPMLLAVSLGVHDSQIGAHASVAALPSPIKHVVVIYQENHTFDEVLGAVCQQRATACNAMGRLRHHTALPFDLKQPVTLADGVTVSNRRSPDIVPIVVHNPKSQRLGRQNRWEQFRGCAPESGFGCIVHFAPHQIPNLSALADAFVVSDATFAAGRAASFGAHIEIGAGTDDGFRGWNPVPSKSGVPPDGDGWGCPSNKDAKWSAAGSTTVSFEPSCVPEADGSGAYRETPVPSVTSIMQQLESAGLTWKIYNGPVELAPSRDGRWNLCNQFAWCWDHRQTTEYNPATAVLESDAANGTLPDVALVPATSLTSQHNGTSMAMGDNYIGELMTALQNGPQWSSTAVFITYDDCGCFYDHVRPPAGLGLRNPMVIASPWAEPGGTDSTVAVQPYSMLAFIDHNFGLPPLSAEVASAYDYAKAFDFRASASADVGIVPMVQQHISADVRHEVRKYLRMHPDDVT